MDCGKSGWPGVLYFDQLLGATRTQKLVEILFSAVSTFFVLFRLFLYEWTVSIYTSAA